MPVVENETLKMGQNFRYSAIMEVKPKFELKDYMGLEVEKEIFSVTDEDVRKQLEEIRRNNGQLKAVDEDRPVKSDDYAVIEYEGFEGEKPIEGIKSTNFLLRVGSNDFHPDFEKGLTGLKKEDTAEIEVNYEDDHHHAKLAGKTVHFKVKVIDIKFMELPQLNDEFARSLGADFNDLDELKQRIEEEIVQREETRVDRELKTRLISKISDGVEFELPETLVKAEASNVVEGIRQNLIRSGSSMEKAGLDEEKLREQFRPAAETRVKEMLILGEIARLDNLSISEMELEEGFREMAGKLGQDPQVIRKFYEAKQMVDSFKQNLLEEKTLNFLVKGANISEREADKITREGE